MCAWPARFRHAQWIPRLPAFDLFNPRGCPIIHLFTLALFCFTSVVPFYSLRFWAYIVSSAVNSGLLVTTFMARFLTEHIFKPP